MVIRKRFRSPDIRAVHAELQKKPRHVPAPDYVGFSVNAAVRVEETFILKDSVKPPCSVPVLEPAAYVFRQCPARHFAVLPAGLYSDAEGIAAITD